MEKREVWKYIYFCFINCIEAFDYVDNNRLWKILKEMGIPDHLSCLLRNLYVGQEVIVRALYEITGSKLGNEYNRSCILSLCLFNFYAEYIMPNVGLDESQA